MKPLMAAKRSPGPASWIALILRVIVGGVLLYAGFSKALGPSAEFAAAIDTYQLVPSHLIGPLAMALPWAEMWIGIFLVAGLFTSYAATGATALFLVFLSALGSSLARGLNLVSCGCFGSDSLSPRQTLWIDLLLLAASFWLATRRNQPQRFAFENL